jgi:hypothetical protein
LQEPIPDFLIERPVEAEFTYPYPSTVTVPIELVALDLVSAEPIQVTYNGGDWRLIHFLMFTSPFIFSSWNN